MFSRRQRLNCYLQKDVLRDYQTTRLERQTPSDERSACFYSLHQPKAFSDSSLWCNPSGKCSLMFNCTKPRSSIKANCHQRHDARYLHKGDNIHTYAYQPGAVRFQHVQPLHSKANISSSFKDQLPITRQKPFIKMHNFHNSA